MKKIVILFFILSFTNSHAQNYWARYFGSDEEEYANKVIASKNGGWITAGYAKGFGGNGVNLHIIKWDDIGEIQWQQVIGGAADEYAYGVTEDIAGNIYATGKTNAQGPANNFDVLLLKFSATGNIIWQRTYGGLQEDFANSLLVTPSNELIIAGGTLSFGLGGKDAYILKTDTSGNIIWTKTFGTTGDEFINSVSAVHDGGYLLAGRTTGFGTSNGYVIRTTSSGDSLWTKAYQIGSLSSAQIYDAVEISNSNFVFTGIGNSFYGNMFHLKTDLNGNQSYIHISTYLADCGYGIMGTPDGGYIVGGCYSNYGTVPFIAKFDSSGLKLWEKRMFSTIASGYPCYNDGRSFVRNTDGSFTIAGGAYAICNVQSGVIALGDSANGISGSAMDLQFQITSSAGYYFCDSSSVNTTLVAPDGFDHYQWIKTSTIAGATSRTYQATEAGYYFCWLTYGEGYIYTPIVNIFVDTVLNNPVITPTGIFSACATSDSTVLRLNSVPHALVTLTL